MANEFKIGIIGTGDIVTRFCNGLKGAEGIIPYAVGSRRQETADVFGDKFDIEKRYDSYEKLVSDPDVDCVYVGVPHPFHKDVALLALSHKKPTLLEKPFTVNARDTKIVIDAARANGTFLMEAYWPRFCPVNRELKRLICEENVIGRINTMDVRAFMGHEGRPKNHRLYDMNMAGGIFMDIGIYPMAYSTYFLGCDPCEVVSSANITEAGWDYQDAVIFRYASGAMAIQTSSFQNDPSWRAQIFGENGWADVPGFSNPEHAVIYPTGRDPIHIDIKHNSNGYEYEAMHVRDCVRAGLSESPIMPLSETQKQMELMDLCRKSWGLKFPCEE